MTIIILNLRAGKLKSISSILLILFMIFSTEIGSNTLLWPLENWHKRRTPESIPPVKTLVVLSGMSYPDQALPNYPEFNSAADRILYAISLMKQNKAEQMLISGGDGSISQTRGSESLTLAAWLNDMGHSFKVLVEPDSRNTYENAVNTASVLDISSNQTIILVTSAFHMPRSVALFEKQGFNVIPYPVDFKTTEPLSIPESYIPSSAGLHKLNIAYSEFLGLLAYRLTGKI